MAQLTYNGVTLPLCDVQSFTVKTMYDPEGHTDYTLSEFDIRVASVVSDDSLHMLAPDLGLLGAREIDPATIIQEIHTRLSTPRRLLRFKFNGVEFIPTTQSMLDALNQNTEGVFPDADNGPRPQGFVPLRMDPGSWVLLYHIVARYRVKLTRSDTIDPETGLGSVTYTNLPSDMALYNRWSDRVDIDERDYTIRTRRGKFMIASDNSKGFVADQMRTLFAQVGVPKGFVRGRRSYVVSPDGLSLQYEIQDREVYRVPPQGAFKAEGKYREESTTGDGKRIGACNVTLWGSKTSRPDDQTYAEMVRTCVALVVAKLEVRGAKFFADVKKQPRGTLLGATIETSMFDNVVTASMRVLFPSSSKVLRGLAGVSSSIVETPGKTPGANASPRYLERGSANILLHTAAYYDPAIGGKMQLAAEDFDRASVNEQTAQRPTYTPGREPGKKE